MKRGSDARVVLLIALAIVAPAILPALAYANPPDPSWIRGIYDDADFDDIVVLVMSATGDLASLAPAVSRPLGPSLERLPQLSETAPLPLSPLDGEPRAPPRS